MTQKEEQTAATPSDDLQPMYAWANEKGIRKTEWARRSAIVEKTARAYFAHDDLIVAVQAFLAYNSSDDGDGVRMMLDYVDALDKCRTALAKAGVA